MGSRITKQIGLSKIVTRNNMPQLATKLASAAKLASLDGAKRAKEEAETVFGGQGNGLWDTNSPLTLKLKGVGKPIMFDSGSLISNLQILPGSDRGFGIDVSTMVGWDDSPHPESNLSYGELATVHEYGAPSISGPHQIPMNSYFGNPAPIPPRPWLSQVADMPTHSEPIINAMRVSMAIHLRRGGF